MRDMVSLKTYSIFLDESSQTAHRYLTMGGLIIDNDCVDALYSEIATRRLPELPAGELKWGKISGSKSACYQRIVDAFYDIGDHCVPLHFHSLVVDTTKRKDHEFNSGSRELGFNKEVYQLLMKFRRLYPNALFHAYLDKRSTSSSPNELQTILNAGAKKAGDRRILPFRRVHFRDSKDDLALQLVDLMLGGISFHINGHHLERNASTSKCQISTHILQRSGIVDPLKDTLIMAKTTIWHRRLR